METPVIWRRPGLQFPTPFDTIFFDIDGVLIKTIDSFHATDIATAEYVVGTIHGLDSGQREGKALLTHEDVIAFKQTRHDNYHLVIFYTLVTLYTAPLHDRRGT